MQLLFHTIIISLIFFHLSIDHVLFCCLRIDRGSIDDGDQYLYTAAYAPRSEQGAVTEVSCFRQLTTQSGIFSVEWE